jgi:cyclin-dependent kinase 8/11
MVSRRPQTDKEVRHMFLPIPETFLTCSLFEPSVFLSIQPQQLPPQRRITHDEASASMQAGVNAAAAPPHVQQQQPLQANSARAATTSTNSFASAGAMGLAVGSAGMTGGIPPSGTYGGTAGGGAYTHGNVGIKRVGVGSQGANDGGVAANTRKKSRMG